VTAALAVKTPCRCATTGNITLIGLQTIDGIALASGDRVLVRQQGDPKTNGIWSADTGAWVRARDFDGARDATRGTMVFVTDGATYGSVFFTLDTPSPIRYGTDNITFTERSTVSGDAAAEDLEYDNAGSGLIAANLQAAIDELAAKFLGQQGTSIASAATTNIGNADSDFVRITGTTTITSFGSATKRHHVWIKFTGILTLTHHATNLILPGAQNIVTAAGDMAELVRISGSSWQCIAYHRASGLSVNKASQAQAEAGTDDATVMTPLKVAQAIAFQAGTAPTGAVLAFARQTPPSGWAECAGQLLVKTAYPNLFAAIGEAFNVGGEAATDFRLPDLRGEFIRGWDNGRGVDSGRTMGTTQDESIGPHSHPYKISNANNQEGDANVNGSFMVDINAPTNATVAILNNTGSENRPRNVALLYCIKT
jgi:microcystin-dependent protein